MDYGRRRLGFALSDPGRIIASPFGKSEISTFEEALAEVRRIFEESGAGELVVGIPFNMDGSLGEMGREARDFAARLASEGLLVREWDERLTTAQAHRSLRNSGLGRRGKKEKTDAVAAQIILQSYLDSLPAR